MRNRLTERLETCKKSRVLEVSIRNISRTWSWIAVRTTPNRNIIIVPIDSEEPSTTDTHIPRILKE